MIKKVKILLLTLILGLTGFASLATARVNAMETVNYHYFIGTDPLCALDPSACPDATMAASGDVLNMTGKGTLSIHPKSVTGKGEFQHYDAAGNLLAEGTWKALQLLSFHSYGSGAAQGLPEEFEGGQALIRVQLYVNGTPVAQAVLQVDCTLGDKIPAGAHEGVRLAVEGGPNFNHEVSGFTLYVRD